MQVQQRCYLLKAGVAHFRGSNAVRDTGFGKRFFDDGVRSDVGGLIGETVCHV